MAVGSWQLAGGSWQLAVGSWQLAVGSWHTQCILRAYAMYLRAYAMYFPCIRNVFARIRNVFPVHTQCILPCIRNVFFVHARCISVHTQCISPCIRNVCSCTRVVFLRVFNVAYVAYARVCNVPSLRVHGARMQRRGPSLCVGVHHPVQPHHFSHLPAVPAPLRPRQAPHQSALPAPAVRPLLRPPAGSGLCLPCAPPLRAAGCATTSPRFLLVGAGGAGLVAGHTGD